ncbi:hypothetical protein [Terribacillus saccharophilus]|uniref:Uncharacterized protein n=1 Tax=Terribacillus saccharophilus TaxID=361277 RepID=A0ABX4GUK4_9BACI|nr:hypothetical protein [Terribacillus saccharophilus]PAD34218.1 hypothetical protein CHH56_15640 [Terribacillus saccharophilus]PAD94809.1 hypothetical protein CHH50_16730 [Terribacillus saccharophilus]PAD98558.1 hypothetical protein CHH48_16740 [Terribacillus saccharophilus]
MATHYVNHSITNDMGIDNILTIAARPSGSNVYASIDFDAGIWDSRIDWEMELQRKTNGVWKTIGTFKGYVSAKSPSNRTYTNVRQTGSQRLLVSFWQGGSYKGAAVTPTWTP